MRRDGEGAGRDVAVHAVQDGDRTQLVVFTMDGRFGSKVGQIDPKWDKFGAFCRSDFIAFGAGRSEKAPNLSHLGPI